jgi:hypothetical protein
LDAGLMTTLFYKKTVVKSKEVKTGWSDYQEQTNVAESKEGHQ